METQNPMPMNARIKFEAMDDTTSIIKVIGVGGGGSNAVSYMFNEGIFGVDFIVSNTDKQALHTSPVMQKVQLGKDLTKGLGAGSKPEVGKNAALESAEDIREMLGDNTKMLFITAGMGGGTGTGAAPVIANIAKEMGILTVAIVTIPFSWEGRKKNEQALNGISELKKNVDSLLLISNDKLREFYGNLTMSNAFSQADDVLKVAAKGISDIVNKIGKVNVDFEDVNTVMRNSGVAIMGSGMAEGENRATVAIEMALASPLLNDNNITGASNILLYITSGSDEITMDEFESISQHVQKEAGATAEIIWGICHDESLEKKIAITIVATGFDYNEITNKFDVKSKPVNKRIIQLEEDEVKMENKVLSIDSEELRIENRVEEELKGRNRMLRKEEKDVVDMKKNLVKSLLDFDNVNKVFSELPEQETTDQEMHDITSKIAMPDEDMMEQKDEEIILNTKEVISDIKNSTSINTITNNHIEEEVTNKANTERNNRLRALSVKIGHKNNNINDIEQMEKEPAFRRRNVTLSDVPSAAESRVSKYTLSEDEDKNVEIKPNNSFLHDNVD